MKAIGETFGNELQVAGLAGLPFSWGDDGTFQLDERMTKEQIDAVMVVYEAHNPTVTYKDTEALIQSKMKELLREQAITALQSEGKLTVEGKMVK